MQRWTFGVTVLAALCGEVLIPGQAHAGWTATQVQQLPGHGITSKVTYGHHHLKIENDPQVMLIDLRSGDMTFVNRQRKEWSRVSLERLVAEQNKALAQMEEQLQSMPPAMRAQVKAQLEAQKKAAGERLEVKKTDEFQSVDGMRCRIHTFSSVEGDGKTCITETDPFDLGDYRSDAGRLRRRLQDLQAGGTKSSMIFLELAHTGFPLKTEQRLRMADQTFVTSIEFKDLKPTQVSADVMAPPEDFQEIPFEQLIGVGGGMAP